MTMARHSTLLSRAEELLTHDPFTLADAKALEELEELASGEEGLLIAEIWESAQGIADDEARLYMSGLR
ncbi:hypothetical protein E2P79_11600 [Aeromonas schubertii]|nr:hypothetical protein E2P79_11600 [Aeromonas schubertii]